MAFSVGFGCLHFGWDFTVVEFVEDCLGFILYGGKDCSKSYSLSPSARWR